MLSARIFIVSVLVWGVACGGGATEGQAPLPSLEPAQVVTVDHDGFERVLASFSGEPVVVNFWATWCAPCKEEMPRLVEAAHAYEGEVRFLAVDVEDSSDAAEEFLRRHDVPFPSLGDPEGDIKRAEKVVGLPTTQFYRADGELAFVHSGEISAADLTERIETLLRIGVPERNGGD